MTPRLDELALPAKDLSTRDDEPWEAREQSRAHREKVLAALRAASVDVLVARYTYGPDADEDPEFHERFIDPLWNGLRASLTRQDLLRWLMDWAQQAAGEEAFRQIQRLQRDLDSLSGT